MNSISNIYSSKVYAFNLDLFMQAKQTKRCVLKTARSASSPERLLSLWNFNLWALTKINQSLCSPQHCTFYVNVIKFIWNNLSFYCNLSILSRSFRYFYPLYCFLCFSFLDFSPFFSFIPWHIKDRLDEW